MHLIISDVYIREAYIICVSVVINSVICSKFIHVAKYLRIFLFSKAKVLTVNPGCIVINWSDKQCSVMWETQVCHRNNHFLIVSEAHSLEGNSHPQLPLKFMIFSLIIDDTCVRMWMWHVCVCVCDPTESI